ncbi:arginine exporter [Citrobacter koseri]|nr:arginine exporter [Citrobacter koseri]
MISYYFQGLALGAAMILPLGPQNAFVMNQGIRRQYHIMIALLCAISDLVLICAGIFGGSALLMQSPWLMALVTWGGVAFLLWYGFGALKNGNEQQPGTGQRRGDEAGALENHRHNAGGDVAESARLSGHFRGTG